MVPFEPCKNLHDYRLPKHWSAQTILSNSVFASCPGDRRVLVALFVSIAFLALQLSVTPHRRAEDGVLTALVNLGLVVVYTNVLLIKSCDQSSMSVTSREADLSSLAKAVCAQYGFGESSLGTCDATLKLNKLDP